MRQLRQMQRLYRDGVSAREIGRLLGVARSTIQENLKRVAAVGLEGADLSRFLELRSIDTGLYAFSLAGAVQPVMTA